MTVKLLEALLDEKDISEKHKTLIRNIVAPALEYVETGTTPEEVIQRALTLGTFLAVPSALALAISIEPKAYLKLQDFMAKNYKEKIGEALEALVSAEERVRIAKLNMDNVDKPNNVIHL